MRGERNGMRLVEQYFIEMSRTNMNWCERKCEHWKEIGVRGDKKMSAYG